MVEKIVQLLRRMLRRVSLSSSIVTVTVGPGPGLGRGQAALSESLRLPVGLASDAVTPGGLVAAARPLSHGDVADSQPGQPEARAGASGTGTGTRAMTVTSAGVPGRAAGPDRRAGRSQGPPGRVRRGPGRPGTGTGRRLP